MWYIQAIMIINYLCKGDLIMAKYVCKVCGYVHEGDAAPSECPVCHASSDKFEVQSDEMS